MNTSFACLLRRGLPLLLAGACHLAPVQAVTISVDPENPAVTSGTSFSLDIRIDNVLNLYAFGFDIGFDPAVLSANSIVEGPFLAMGGTTLFIDGSIDNTAGTISFTSGSLQGVVSGVDGSGVLATVNFTALAVGSSLVNVFNSLGGELELFDPDLNTIVLDGGLQSAEVTVNPATPGPGPGLPEPGTWMLVSAGLLGLLVARRPNPK